MVPVVSGMIAREIVQVLLDDEYDDEIKVLLSRLRQGAQHQGAQHRFEFSKITDNIVNVHFGGERIGRLEFFDKHWRIIEVSSNSSYRPPNDTIFSDRQKAADLLLTTYRRLNAPSRV